jgi:hypothetical protein
MHKASVFETDYFGWTPNGTSKISSGRKASSRRCYSSGLSDKGVHQISNEVCLNPVQGLAVTQVFAGSNPAASAFEK